MGFRNFRFQVVLRVALLLVVGYAAIYVATQTYFWLVAFWLILLEVFLIVGLIRYVERSERSLTHFLWSISQNDFTHTFGPDPSVSDDRLRDAYLRILQIFRRLRDEKESHHQYLQTVVEHVRVALLCYDEQEEIRLMNAAAKSLLRKPTLKNLHSLDKIDPQLRTAIQQQSGGPASLIKLEIDQRLVSLSIHTTRFKLHEETYTLVAFQDIRHELEAQEVEAWQKLIRVLTHEIMNSVIPISTLTSVVSDMLVDKQGELADLSVLDAESASDLRGSLHTIESRSRGLVNFVKAYKSITQLPEPHFANVPVPELLRRVHTLLKPEASEKGIRLEVAAALPELSVKADLEMVEQVLINLIRNAFDAVKDRPLPLVRLSAGINASRQVYISVKDNGSGIDPEVLPHIFVPFFTTKSNGTGVGLSLSRQLMLLHKGNIAVHSHPDEGTIFTLVF
jgi:two-component system, NtrC family, nitrogen regulation sensor histidine kinase NtrY